MFIHCASATLREIKGTTNRYPMFPPGTVPANSNYTEPDEIRVDAQKLEKKRDEIVINESVRVWPAIIAELFS